MVFYDWCYEIFKIEVYTISKRLISHVYIFLQRQKKKKNCSALSDRFSLDIPTNEGTSLTGSRCSSVSLMELRCFTGMSSLHSLSDALGDSARSRNSSRFGPLNLILSSRFSMFNTEICVFILTWRVATL